MLYYVIWCYMNRINTYFLKIFKFYRLTLIRLHNNVKYQPS